MADIFLSYAREDRPWASRLAAELTERGWTLFWDPDIPVGKTFDHVIENQLDSAGCIVVLWSRHSVSSNWVKAEASEGVRRGVLHPILIERGVRLPLEFRRLQTANLIEWQRGTPHVEFDQLVEGIAATLRVSGALSARLHEARAALGRGEWLGCLEILREIAAAAETSGLGDEVAELRRDAEAGQEEARRRELSQQRALAEERRAALGARRSDAQAADAATRASALWQAAEAKMGEVAAAFDDEGYLRAAAYCGEAATLYDRARDAAREAAAREERDRQRHAAEHAAERMAQARESAQAADARERAPRLWVEAEQRATEGQAAVAEDDPIRAMRAFEEAAAAYGQAEEEAREHTRREEMQRRARADQARDAAREQRSAAATRHAARRAPGHWTDGERALAGAEGALASGDYLEAQRLFDGAARLYQGAEFAAREVRDRERQAADAGRGRMAAAREADRASVATLREDPLWAAAEASVAAAEAAYAGEHYAEATDGFDKAADLFRTAHDKLRAARDAAPQTPEAPASEGEGPGAEGSLEADGREPSAQPTIPEGRLPRRPPWKPWIVACAGGVAVVLGVLGVHWHRSTPVRAPEMSQPRVSPAPPPAPAPSTTGRSLPPDGNREREVTDDLRQRAAGARDQAMKAGAERLAGALFATAAGHYGDAEAALAGGRLADAQAAYRRSLDGFALAASEAVKATARTQDEIGRLSVQIDDARSTAAAAQAERLAGPQWTKATELHRQAQEATARGDQEKAGELLRAAIASFGDAAKAATTEAARLATLKKPEVPAQPGREVPVGPAGARPDAEQAREQMAAAKRAAEQAREQMAAAKRAAERVAAGFFAHQRFTAAQSKERDGMAALGRADYRAAIRLLGEAQSEYRVAVQEAQREAEEDQRLAPLKEDLEKAHAAAAAARQQALAAGADRLTRDLFDQAQARQVDGDGLRKRKELAAATAAYREAAGRYGEAAARARAAR